MLARDRQTNQFKKVYVKALDSMPVGTVVDFNGQASDIPSGWEEVSGKSLVAYTLYESESGTNGNITLNDSALNYEYLMVFYKSTYNLDRRDVKLAPNNGNWSLFSLDIDASNYQTIYQNCTRYNISRTSMNVSMAKNFNGDNQNMFYITKVIGYKEV